MPDVAITGVTKAPLSICGIPIRRVMSMATPELKPNLKVPDSNAVKALVFVRVSLGRANVEVGNALLVIVSVL